MQNITIVVQLDLDRAHANPILAIDTRTLLSPATTRAHALATCIAPSPPATPAPCSEPVSRKCVAAAKKRPVRPRPGLGLGFAPDSLASGGAECTCTPASRSGAGVRRELRSENVEPKKSPCKKPQSTTGMVNVFGLASTLGAAGPFSLPHCAPAVGSTEPRLELCWQ